MDKIWEKQRVSAWSKKVFCILCTVLALGVVFVLAYHNQDWKHIWLATSMNNDEVFYNRQVVGVLACGQPKGIFGYNESTAQFGHFGGWGPLLIYLQALVSVPVGIGVNTVFWSNVILFLLGWLFFVWCSPLSWKRQIILGVAFACVWLPMDEVFSGTSEPIQYALILVLFGSCFAMQRKMRPLFFGIAMVACFLTTGTRAYTVLLGVFPLALTWKKNRKYKAIGLVCAGTSLFCFLFSETYCNAPYFDNMGTDLQGGELLLDGKVAEAISYELSRLKEGVAFLFQSTMLTLSGQPQEQGRAVLIFGIVFLVMVGCLVYDWIQKRAVLLKAITLVCVVLILSAIFLVYSAGVIQRHLVMLCVWMLCVLIWEDFASFAVVIPLCALLLPMNLASSNIPTYSAEMDGQMVVIEEALRQRMDADSDGDAWDYTLAYAWGDGVFHGYLYSVPAGMGIQFDQSDYLADTANPIHARYAMVGHDTGTEQRLITDGWQELVSTKDLVVYERRDDLQ